MLQCTRAKTANSSRTQNDCELGFGRQTCRNIYVQDLDSSAEGPVDIVKFYNNYFLSKTMPLIRQLAPPELLSGAGPGAGAAVASHEAAAWPADATGATPALPHSPMPATRPLSPQRVSDRSQVFLSPAHAARSPLLSRALVGSMRSSGAVRPVEALVHPHTAEAANAAAAAASASDGVAAGPASPLLPGWAASRLPDLTLSPRSKQMFCLGEHFGESPRKVA